MKRTYGQYRKGHSKATLPAKKRVRTLAPSQRGYLRTSGYYGRFSGRNSEHKFIDTIYSANAPAGSSSMLSSLNLIPQGTTESQRIGRKCVIKNIYFRGDLRVDSASTLFEASVFRLIVIQDKQANGAAPLATDVMDYQASVNTFRNLANSNRFKVLKDYTTSIDVYPGTTPLSSRKTFKFGLKCNIPIEFSGTTGVIGEVRSNNIFCMLIADSTGGNASLDAIARVRFSDN